MGQRKGYIALLVLLAIMAFAELIFSNLGMLFNEPLRVEIGTQLGLTDQQEVLRLVILAIFDLIAGSGVVMLLIAALRPDQARLIMPGRWLALIGYLGYGIYQLIAAFTVIDPNYRGVVFAAVLYIGMGIITFVIGNQLKRA